MNMKMKMHDEVLVPPRQGEFIAFFGWVLFWVHKLTSLNDNGGDS